MDNFWVKAILTQVKRDNPDGTNRKLGITLAILRCMARSTDINSPVEVAFMCAALFAFFCFLRKSNVSLKPSQEDIFAPDQHPPRREDIIHDSKSNQLWLRLRFTKTIQFRERQLMLSVPIIDGDILDPLMWYKRHLALSPSNDPSLSAFSFKDVSTGSMCPMLHAIFTLRTKRHVANAGLDPASFSGHSYRRGGATFAFECGIPGELIKVMGDWTSDAYLLYLNFSHALRAAIAPRIAAMVKNFALRQ